MGRLHVLCGGAGPRPSTETLSAGEVAADSLLAEVFGRPVGAPLYLIRRRRYIDNRAVLVEGSSSTPRSPPACCGSPFDQSLTSILKSEYGLAVARNHEVMQPCALTQHEAEALRVKSGLPGLSVVRTSYDAQDASSSSTGSSGATTR